MSELKIHIPLRDSFYLAKTPELQTAEVGGTVYVSPTTYSSWADLFTQHPNAVDYIFMPGDYTSWSNLIFAAWGVGSKSGTPTRRRTLRYVSSVPPWKRGTNDRATLFSIDFWESEYWTVTGFTMTGPIIVRQDAGNIVIHECHYDNAPDYCVRLFGFDTVVQRVFCDTLGTTGSDAPAFQVRIADTVLLPVNNRIVDCEVRDWNDGVGITQLGTPAGNEMLPVNGTVVDGNDFYMTSGKYLYEGAGPYQYADGENAIDIKAGSDDPQKPIVFSNNRISGFRYTAPSVQLGGKSSNGAAVTNHFGSRNVLFERNIISNCPIGWFENVWPNGAPYPANDQPRGTRLVNNIWHDIRPFTPDDVQHGIYYLGVGVDIDGDKVIDGSTMAYQNVPGTHPPESQIYAKNMEIDGCPLGPIASVINAGVGQNYRTVIVEYERNRLSGSYWESLQWCSPDSKEHKGKYVYQP